MGRQRPDSVTHAIRAQWAVLLVGCVTTVLTVVQREALIDNWAARQPPGAQPPAVAPVAVVLFVTFALLIAVLVVFFRAGHDSARLSLTGVAVFYLVAMLAVYRLDPPVLFVVLAAVSSVLDLALLRFLWHRDTTAFLRGAGLAAGRVG